MLVHAGEMDFYIGDRAALISDVNTNGWEFVQVRKLLCCLQSDLYSPIPCSVLFSASSSSAIHRSRRLYRDF